MNDECPRCGLMVIAATAVYGPCDDCRTQLRRIYSDRDRVRIASLAHIVPEQFNDWLREPCESFGGDTPWQWIDAGFTDQVIAHVKTLKRSRPLEDD
jgi:hypothetical protein